MCVRARLRLFSRELGEPRLRAEATSARVEDRCQTANFHAQRVPAYVRITFVCVCVGMQRECEIANERAEARIDSILRLGVCVQSLRVGGRIVIKARGYNV